MATPYDKVFANQLKLMRSSEKAVVVSLSRISNPAPIPSNVFSSAIMMLLS